MDLQTSLQMGCCISKNSLGILRVAQINTPCTHACASRVSKEWCEAAAAQVQIAVKLVIICASRLSVELGFRPSGRLSVSLGVE